jgi:cytochrome b subunit of formate dehydrogenase
MKKLNKLINWLLLIIVIIYIITGLGMTQYQTMEKLTFGLLSKPLSFKIHTNLLPVLIVLAILHIYPNLKRRKK